ncbi:MAG: 16S rRNA (adenine(1518)-N(6)/adenine(1519)-N(6))-dimethyltransferase RsmA [Candidatus Obscuribacterales bacterium]
MSGDKRSDELVREARKLTANKKLGQNFFVDSGRLDRIAEAVNPSPSDHIIEIGAGLGFLTSALAASGARITAIELDERLYQRLIDKFRERSSVSIVHGDFLSFDLGSLPDTRVKIAGNIPYQITSPIISRIFGEIGKPRPWLAKIDEVVITIQLEVAERLVARPGGKDYSQLTVLKDYYFDAELLFKVPPECFLPRPEITSAVVRLKPHAAPPVKLESMDYSLLRTIVRCGFKQRRKMLKNNLGFLKLSDREISDILRSLKINPLARAEDLSLIQFGMLTDAVAALHK